MPFQLSDSVLLQMRTQANLSMQDDIHIYTVTVSHNMYGEQIVTSGLPTTAKGLIASLSGKEDDLVSALKDEGLLKSQSAKLLLPFETVLETSQVIVDSGTAREWDVVWANYDMTDEYQLYTKAVITRDIVISPYKDQKVGGNG